MSPGSRIANGIGTDGAIGITVLSFTRRATPMCTVYRRRLITSGRVIVLVILAACAADDPRSASRLILERFPCLGTCPSYRLAIGADGRVEYEGMGYFNTLAAASERPTVRRDSTRLAPGDVATLMTAFDRAWSRRWPNQYRPSKFGCPRWGTDAPTLVVVRQWGSRRDTLYGYYGCPYVPARIHRLGIYIDSVVGVKRWLGPAPPR
jgi:hypothetical protein